MQLSHRNQPINLFAGLINSFSRSGSDNLTQLSYRGQRYSAIDFTVEGVVTQYSANYRGVNHTATVSHAAQQSQSAQLQYRGVHYAI